MIKKRLEILYPEQNVYKDLEKILNRYPEVLVHRQNANSLTSADSMLDHLPRSKSVVSKVLHLDVNMNSSNFG